MDVLEFSVRADAEAAEALAALFSELAFGGAVIEETVTPEENEELDLARPYTVRAFLLVDETVEAKRLGLEEAVWHLGRLRTLGEPQVRRLKEEDWAHAWKKFYTVQHPGKRLVIKPSWLEYTPAEGELVIELDPGMAFGSGLHPSTRLCLRALEEYRRPGMKALDVGTGSGILAIAAARLGARRVKAVDIDPVAVEVARENVRLNGVEGIVVVEQRSKQLEPMPGHAPKGSEQFGVEQELGQTGSAEGGEQCGATPAHGPKGSEQFGVELELEPARSAEGSEQFDRRELKGDEHIKPELYVKQARQGPENGERFEDEKGHDVVVANILAEVIVELAPRLAGELKRGGKLITSGILAEKKEWVEQALVEAGLRIVNVTREEDWVAVVGGRE